MSGCNLSRWSRWKRTYQPGLSWGGVGNTYTKNEISNGPHSGILGGGMRTINNKHFSVLIKLGRKTLNSQKGH